MPVPFHCWGLTPFQSCRLCIFVIDGKSIPSLIINYYSVESISVWRYNPLLIVQYIVMHASIPTLTPSTRANRCQFIAIDEFVMCSPNPLILDCCVKLEQNRHNKLQAYLVAFRAGIKRSLARYAIPFLGFLVDAQALGITLLCTVCIQRVLWVHTIQIIGNCIEFRIRNVV